jgi:hypothetical protein
VRSLTRSRRAAVPQQVDNGLAGLSAGIGTLRERSQGAVETLTPKIEQAREALAPRIEAAREVAGQALTGAGEWATPRIETARDQAVTTVREKVAPAVTKAVTQAAVASAPTLQEAKTRADAALAALRGEVGPPKRKRRWHRASFLLAAGTATGIAVALVVRRKEPTFSPYEPPYDPTSGGSDPYAQPTPVTPTTTQQPSAPITSLTEEIAGNLNPAPPQTSESGTDQVASADDATTVDVTDAATGGATDDATGETAGAGGRHRKRTRRGEPQE